VVHTQTLVRLEELHSVAGRLIEQELAATAPLDDGAAERGAGLPQLATTASRSPSSHWIRFHPPGG